MARYLIESPHTEQECLEVLDSVVAQGPGALARFDFACAVGDHSRHMAYVTVDAASESAARSTLPGPMAAKAQVVEVGKFTADQVRSFHQG
ncbi:MAG TPA: hypothetical protein VH951_05920 [Dehalococcoidia bacterium]